MPYDLFISYSRHDREFASLLARELGRSGTRGFLDKQDISAGAQWSESIRSAIEASDAIVLILSPEAIRSNYVMAEVGMAQSLEKRIIPVLAPGARLEDSISELVSNYRVLDASDLPIEETSARIVATIKRIPVESARLLLPRRRQIAMWISLLAALALALVVAYAIFLMTG